MRAVLVAWGIASLATGAANVAEVFLAKHTFSAGNLGYGLLYGAMGAGLVLGSLYSAAVLARSGVARTYGASLTLMAMGYAGAALSPNVWVAALCLLFSGAGNGAAIACNALLVQRSTFDLLRGRALTFVMSVTYVLVGVGSGIGGVLLERTSPRWIWAACGLGLLAAALVGFLLTRHRRRRQTPTVPEVKTPAAPAALDPYQAALERLAAVEQEHWPARGEVTRHYEAVVDVLRDYLEAVEQVRARKRTSAELMWSLPPHLSTDGLRERCGDVLAEADLVKFARIEPDAVAATAFLRRARGLLERWHTAAERRMDAVDAVR
jgi:MFS family permease